MKPKQLKLKKVRVTELTMTAAKATKGGNDVISWCNEAQGYCCDSNGCWCIYGAGKDGNCLLGLEA